MSESIQNPQAVIDALVAQCDAVKQMHNEVMSSNLQLRTQLIVLQKQLKTLADENEGLKKNISDMIPKPE